MPIDDVALLGRRLLQREVSRVDTQRDPGKQTTI
jgi:hypothetical protein